MGPLQLSGQVVQNHQTGEQMTHWDMLGKENSNLGALSEGAYHLSQLASQTGHFENEISFFGEFLLKKSSRYAYYVEMN